MPLTNAAAGFIGASVTLVLVIIFMILMVILVRQCLAFLAKRNTIRVQVEEQRQQREQLRRRRGSITEPIPATFDWHHSIRIAGTPPPTYHEAKKLPSFEDAIVTQKKENVVSENGTTDGVDGSKAESNGNVHSSSNEEETPAVKVSPNHDHSNSEQITIEVPVALEGGVSEATVSPNQSSSHSQSSPDHVEVEVERLADESRTTFATGYTEFGTTTPM